MSAADTRVGRRRAVPPARPGVLPLAAALLAVAWVAVWLVVRDAGALMPGYAGGPVAMAAAFVACRRIGTMIVVARPIRGFWRLFSHAAICVGIGSVGAFAFANNNPGLSPYMAVPTALGVVMTMLALSLIHI